MSKTPAFNPYLPSWEYIPDGEPYVFGDRVYVYGSHDFFNGYVFCMGDYMCWSAPVDDLGDWRCEGIIYGRCDDPMNKEDLKHIFERLYKCDKGRSEKGSGLGLSIVHQLVEKMGGNITVESVPGKGTEFMLLFPLEI